MKFELLIAYLDLAVSSLVAIKEVISSDHLLPCCHCVSSSSLGQ